MAEEITERKMMDMKLHDDIAFNTSTMNITIQRVVGGWIYWRAAQKQSDIEGVSTSASIALAAVFVPEPNFPPKQR